MADKVDEIPRLPRNRKPKNKPIDSNWRQQTLPAKRPVLTINNACPSVMILGLIIFGLGLLLFFYVDQSLEIVTPYLDCVTADRTPAKELARLNLRPICNVSITLDKDFTGGTVKFFYQLDNFYQNFRTYTTSRNDKQLEGDLYQTSGCDPYECEFAPGYTKDNASCSEKSYQLKQSYPIVPCGAIANSMFNDTFVLWYHPPPEANEPMIRVPFSVEGVLSKAERKKKFKNPDNNPSLNGKYNGTGCDQFTNAGAVKPKDWQGSICDLGPYNDTDDNDVHGLGWALTNIDFEVWMKPAALPRFRKPYRTLDQNYDPFNTYKGLPAGNYSLIIEYNYNVEQFNVNKAFVIAKESWMGPRNFFLPIIYMITGCFIMFSMTVLFIIAKVKERYSKEST